MKKALLKICRIMFGAFLIAMLVLIVFAMMDSDAEIEMPGFLLPFCGLVLLGTGVCILIALVLAFWDGWKKDKIGLLKQFAKYYVIIGIGMTFVQLTDGLEGLDIPKLLLQVLVSTCGILAGEYIWSKHDE